MLAGKISGGHHNPAVSMAFLVANGNGDAAAWFVIYVVA
jgi:glycerol uptake facilitator-like aquaporin